MSHVLRNWKKYALLAATAASAYYGVDPELAREFLGGFAGALVGQ